MRASKGEFIGVSQFVPRKGQSAYKIKTQVTTVHPLQITYIVFEQEQGIEVDGSK